MKGQSRSGIARGLFIDGANDCTVRLNWFQGDHAVFSNCRKMIFDGNKVMKGTIEFRQSKAGALSKTKILKCDFYNEKLIVHAPRNPKKPDVVRIDKCWFKASRNKMLIHDNFIEDRRDSENNGARVVLQKILDRPLKLAGEAE